MELYDLLFANKINGGGSSVTVEPLSVTQNGTYSETGKAYTPVAVNVPNPSTGTLNITENGTYDVTEKASAVVNVSGGGGLELLAEQSLGDISTSSTSEITVGTQFEVAIDGIYNYIFIVAKSNTAKASHHGATVAIFEKSGNASRLYTPHVNYIYNSSGALVALTNPTGTLSYGIYPSVAASIVKLNITMKAKYHSSYTQTIDNNYTVYVYGVKETDILR